jgi:hypothetical protein
MRSVPYVALVLCACASLAQEPAKSKSTLSAEQIIDRSIEATGGRALMDKLKSTHARGVMEFTEQDAHGSMELFAKAPDKQLLIMNLESVGEIRQAFDGAIAWGQDASGRVVEIGGAPLGDLQRSAVFNAALKWREQFPKAELTGQETVGGRKAWVIRLTPVSGQPITRYFDTETFLLLREAGNRDTPQGPMDVRADFSDYRDVGGIKAPFLIRQTLPMGEIVLRISEMQNNVEIDDARFAKPASKP